jgi:hypothetical protein
MGNWGPSCSRWIRISCDGLDRLAIRTYPVGFLDGSQPDLNQLSPPNSPSGPGPSESCSPPPPNPSADRAIERRVSPRFHAGCRAQLRRGLLLAIAATCPMLVSVMADTAVTVLRIVEERPPVWIFLIPLLSIAVEVAFAAVLVTALGKALRSTLRASSLLSS